MFTSISLKNFRGFGTLTLDNLQRVNLVVGRNNAGKTSLLEGIAALADRALLGQMPSLFRATHGGYPQRFYRWLMRDAPGVDYTELAGRGWEVDYRLVFRHGGTVSPGAGFEAILQQPKLIAWRSPQMKSLRCRIISVQTRHAGDLVKTFAQAVRQRDGEKRLESLLQAVDPRVLKARVDVAEDGNVIVVDLGLSEMVPLTQAGEGMYRLVSIFADLIGEQPQICFIDEVENGIHHTVLPEVWAGIAEVADRLDIQVFATTHSFECLEAAHLAFSKRPSYDLGVVQLFRVEDRTEGRVLQRDLIEAGLSGNIDLR